jgi:hypothetical protein
MTFSPTRASRVKRAKTLLDYRNQNGLLTKPFCLELIEFGRAVAIRCATRGTGEIIHEFDTIFFLPELRDYINDVGRHVLLDLLRVNVAMGAFHLLILLLLLSSLAKSMPAR